VVTDGVGLQHAGVDREALALDQIKVIVDGDRQTVFLTSDAGDGPFELRR
jgi:hypothetical protein